jgi:hypothetical protein
LDGVQVCRSAGIFDVVSKRGHPMESKRSGSSVRISFTREEIAEVIKVADDRRDYAERTGLYFAGARPEEQEQWLAVRKEAAAKLDPETAEVTFTWGDMTDPYWLRACDEMGAITLRVLLAGFGFRLMICRTAAGADGRWRGDRRLQGLPATIE